MTKEEIEAFLKELSAVKKLLQYIPNDIIEHHILDIVEDIKLVNELDITFTKKQELQNSLESYRKMFDDEINSRSK